MTGSARSLLTRWRRHGAVGVPLALALAGAPACGARDGVANPTTPVAPTSTTRITTTTGRPLSRFAGFSDPTYARGVNWLCGPRATPSTSDRCLVGNQDTTIIEPDGTTRVRPSDDAPDPPVDCFYVYPAFDLGDDIDNAMSTDTRTEDALVFEQAARLRERCRVYAPLFRQTGLTGNASISYGDVRLAFKHYMGQWNGGRRIVLFGHAQGADHLTRLLQDEFDDDPDLRALLVSAILVGSHVEVATGARTGGTFHTIPTCASATEAGCVVAWSMVSPSTPRDIAARWGEAPPGRTRVCVNPGHPGGGPGPLTPIIPIETWNQPSPDVSTPFVELPGVISAECVTTGAVTSLVVRPTTHDPVADTRNGPALTVSQPVWGLHRNEVMLAMGSVMDLIGEETASPP
jgi:hypothetical protein